MNDVSDGPFSAWQGEVEGSTFRVVSRRNKLGVRYLVIDELQKDSLDNDCWIEVGSDRIRKVVIEQALIDMSESLHSTGKWNC